MKQFTKKQIITRILEAKSRPEEKTKPYVPKSAEGKPFRKAKLSRLSNVFPFGDTNAPTAYILNNEKIAGEHIFLVPFTPEDATAWINQNKEWIQQRWTELTGRTDMPDIATNLKFVPIGVSSSGFFKPTGKKLDMLKDAGINWDLNTGEPMSIKARTLRNLYGIIRQTMSETNINEFLKNNALPIIKMPEQKNYEQQQYKNRYSEFNDSHMNITIHNNIYFNQIEEYIQYIQNLIFGDETNDAGIERQTPRKYNPGKRWDVTRFTDKQPESFKENPLTPITKQPLRGYSDEDKNYFVTIEFFIDAYHQNGQVYWDLRFITSSGSKLKEDKRVNNVVTDKAFQANGSTVITNTEAPYMDSESLDKFRELLEDLFDQIKTIDTEEELINKMDIDRTKITQKIDQ
jgi:hypothetical protein